MAALLWRKQWVISSAARRRRRYVRGDTDIQSLGRIDLRPASLSPAIRVRAPIPDPLRHRPLHFLGEFVSHLNRIISLLFKPVHGVFYCTRGLLHILHTVIALCQDGDRAGANSTVDTKEVIRAGSDYLMSLRGRVFDLLTLSKPISTEAAANLSKLVSKLSPLVGNLIEFSAVEFLNRQEAFKGHGRWKRQDPDFPDTVFEGSVAPTPGFEIKAWFPLATEITARFKDSQNRFRDDATYVCVLAWLPECLVYGKPLVIDAVVVSGMSVAKARDDHYHNPPDYLVIEPEDTTSRTRNLQQTNTNGYKWQGTSKSLLKAKKMVASWGPKGRAYKPTREYQERCRELLARFPYRLDTNYAKMDRIVHPQIEAFKTRVGESVVNGSTVREWARIFASGDDAQIKEALHRHLGI
jgi:hypothetical protein